ncbi:MAG: hypothetical protein PHU25_18230 [Deltaproteobacteria bacterium]|nr:hypothetical protein [Deltaproteobacteria bacterium]
MSDYLLDDLKKALSENACAPIEDAVPPWPSEKGEHYFTLAHDFTYSHQPSHTCDEPVSRAGEDRSSSSDEEDRDWQPLIDDLFCVPRTVRDRLLSVLKQTKGGSVLVTGYRGTGKTSLTNQVIEQLKKKDEEYQEKLRERYCQGRKYILSFAILFPVFWGVIAFIFSPSHLANRNSYSYLTWCSLIVSLAAILYFFVHKRLPGLVVSMLSEKVAQLMLPIDKLDECEVYKLADKPMRWAIWFFNRILLSISADSSLKKHEKGIFYLRQTHRRLGDMFIATIYIAMIVTICGYFYLLKSVIYTDPAQDINDYLFWIYTGMLSLAATNIVAYLFWARHIVIKLLVRREGRYIRIGINLSTSRDAASLAAIMIRELYMKVKEGGLPRVPLNKFEIIYRRSRGFARESFERSNQDVPGAVGKAVEDIGNLSGSSAPIKAATTALGRVLGKGRETKKTREYTEGPYSLHDAQGDLVSLLTELRQNGHTVIFVFDELDKLIPRDEGDRKNSYDRMLYEIQSIVADLRFLLVESLAFNIFIAGKVVDDSWHEDQNKGDGLFESVFVQNIYLPSVLSLDLEASLGPHRKWLEREWDAWIFNNKLKGEEHKAQLTSLNAKDRIDYYRYLADGLLEVFMEILGIEKKHWTYNTGKLILPHFSEDEWRRLILNASERIPKERSGEPLAVSSRYTNKDYILPYLYQVKKRELVADIGGNIMVKLEERDKCRDPRCPFNELLLCQYSRLRSMKCESKIYNDKKRQEPEKETERELFATSERHCRHMRYLLQYLTFKGRGIPRKVLREFYALIRHREALKRRVDPDYWEKRGNPKYILHIEDSQQQRIKFYSNIVARLEEKQDVFRAIGDKGEVALFHIIDHILKFHGTSFTWNDIENASFMSDRVELFPSRELTQTLLGLLEDVLIERLDHRHRSYVLLPRMRHDLAALYLKWPAEQIDLRFTDTEFKNELNRLNKQLEGVEEQEPEKRLESMRAQARIGQIFELIGNQQEALFAYSKALRWVRTAILELEKCDEKGETKNDLSVFRLTSIINYLTIGIEIAHSLGHINEKGREFRLALQYYETALSFMQYAWDKIGMQEEKGKYVNLLSETITPKRKNRYYHGNGEDIAHRILPGEKYRKGSILEDGNNDVGWIYDMLPKAKEDNAQIIPFGHGKPKKNQPYNTALVPLGLPRTLNQMAIVSEKMWHRYSANKYLMQVVDYFKAVHDDFAAIEQMVFIGEVMVRRRDMRMAARWYTLALAHAMEMEERPDDGRPGFIDRRLKLPTQQSTMRAKMYEHLGDIHLATNGTAFIKSDEVNKIEGGEETAAEKVRREGFRYYRKMLEEDNIRDVDHRDEEYFYAHAIHQYVMNEQPMRVADVYFKKLDIRYEKLKKALKNGGDKEWDIYSHWCSFWVSAENCMNALAKPQKGIAGDYAETFIVHDRRRFGILCYHIGRMMELAATENLKVLWKEKGRAEEWEKRRERENGKKAVEYLIDGRINQTKTIKKVVKEYTDLKKAQRAINHIYSVLVDDRKCDLQKKRKVDVGGNSMLWNLCKYDWRKGKTLKQEGRNGDGEEYESRFIIGNVKDMKSEEKDGKDMDSLYMAEVALLNSWLSMNDNIRDTNAARVCQEIGGLYIKGIMRLLKKEEETTGKEGGKRECKMKKMGLYMMMHVASKRYLAASIDIYRSEEGSQRHTYEQLGRSLQKMAELMLIRSVMLAGIKKGEEGGKEEDVAKKLWKEQKIVKGEWEIESGEGGDRGYMEMIDAQKNQCADDGIEDCMQQASRAYREALRAFLEEKDEYMKRYRFPHDAFLAHNTVMDRDRHYDICESVHRRHWDYGKGEGDARGKVQEMHEEMRRLVNMELFTAPPTVQGEEVGYWMKNLKDLMECIDRNALEGCMFEVIEKEEEGKKEYEIGVRGKESLRKREENGHLRRFFRSYDDCLNVTIGEEKEQGEATTAP